MLETIDQIGFATHDQLARLFFVGRSNRLGRQRSASAARKAAQRALQRLWQAGYIDRRPVMRTSRKTGFGYQAFLNVVSAKGASELRRHFVARGYGNLRWTKRAMKLSSQTIEHSIAINDFYIRLREATEVSGIRLVEWKDDRQLTAMLQLRKLRLISIPDAFFVLEYHDHQFGHFLEVDLGTETGVGRFSEGVWQRKIAAYGEYFRERYPKDTYFRGFTQPIVMTVTNSNRRRESLLAATRRARGAGAYWYATQDELERESSIEINGKRTVVPGLAPIRQHIWRVVNDRQPRSILDRLLR